MSSGCIDFETGISFIVRCLFRHLVARHGSSLAAWLIWRETDTTMRLCASCMLAAAVASTAAGGMVCVTGVVESQQVIAGGSGSNFTNETSQAISATIASTSTGVPPGTTDPRCARYCYPCGAGTGFNLCTAAEAAAGGKAIYTFVTRSTADAMATQPTKFRNLMVCETDNCNTVTTKLCDLANISAASAAGSDSKSAIPFADTKCLLADFVAVSGLCSGKRVRVSSCSSKASVAQFEVLASKRMNSYTTQECQTYYNTMCMLLGGTPRASVCSTDDASACGTNATQDCPSDAYCRHRSSNAPELPCCSWYERELERRSRELCLGVTSEAVKTYVAKHRDLYLQCADSDCKSDLILKAPAAAGSAARPSASPIFAFALLALISSAVLGIDDTSQTHCD